MDEQLENRLRFLRKANTEGMPHSDRGLFDHLLGTQQLLVEWGARPALCDAGLFHSIYSTEHYEQKAVALTRRDEVRQLIGEEAESLVFVLHDASRNLFPGSRKRPKPFRATPPDRRADSTERHPASGFAHAAVCQFVGGVSQMFLVRAAQCVHGASTLSEVCHSIGPKGARPI